MLDKLGGYVSKLRAASDDDSVDRLNYLYTNIIILAFATTVAAKQYVGQPLQCWVPAQFTGGWEAYAEDYCFVENTYWVPMYEQLPEDYREREDRELQYYQWVPFVLALQAMMFYLPRLLWSMLNWQSGLNVTAIVQHAFQTQTSGDKKTLKKSAEYKKDIELISAHYAEGHRYYKDKKNNRSTFGKTLTKGWGIQLTASYLLIKLLYIINVVAQFLILNSFLGPQYSWWGVGILRDIAQGREWESSGHFPRVTMCDFEVRRLGNLHRWSIQCVLQINMFNEKIYLFLWWWFLFVIIMTIMNFLYWVLVSVHPYFGISFVERYLRFKKKIGTDLHSGSYDKEVRRFARKMLRRDGITVLRLVSDNAGDIVTCDVIAALWDVYWKDDSTRPTAPLSDGDGGYSKLGTMKADSVQSPYGTDLYPRKELASDVDENAILKGYNEKLE